MWSNEHRISFSDESNYDEPEANINVTKYRRRDQKMNEVEVSAGNNMMTERQDVEYRRNRMNSKVLINEPKKDEIPSLKSLIVFCGKVSVVGLSYVANTSASAYRRSFWLLLILAGAAFTTYQIQDRIRYYLAHPVKVVIHEEYEEEMTFPTVTICNENQVSLSKATSMGICISVVTSSNCYAFLADRTATQYDRLLA